MWRSLIIEQQVEWMGIKTHGEKIVRWVKLFYINHLKLWLNWEGDVNMNIALHQCMGQTEEGRHKAYEDITK